MFMARVIPRVRNYVVFSFSIWIFRYCEFVPFFGQSQKEQQGVTLVEE